MHTILLADILTQDPSRPRAEGVLIAAGRVIALGSREELLAIAPRAEVSDLRGSLLTPGLTDAHLHLVGYGFALGRAHLEGSRSVAELGARLRAFAAEQPEGWLLGNGYLLSELGLSDYPTAAELDAIVSDRPVLLWSRDLHSAWANSRALELAGLSAATPDPEGGRIVRDASGNPSGVLLELATRLVARAIPEPTEQDILEAARRAVAQMRAYGYTAVHTMASEPPRFLRALHALEAAGELPLRVWACLPHTSLEAARTAGLQAGTGDRVRVGGIKFFADGALGSRTAWLHAPGFADGSGTGIPLDPPELIEARGREALELGLIPTVHAIGDRANTEVLDVFERLKPLADARGVRLRLEHAQHLREADLPRFAQLGVTVSPQPVHLIQDAASVRTLLPHLEAGTYAFRRLLDSGALLAFGSDAPVADPDPLLSFRSAVERLDDEGQVFGPSERITLEETLFAHTRGPALAVGWQDYGVVRPGARADFTRWDRLGGEREALTFSESQV
ncbi:hypothetical protein HNR42_002134 [Deinobacterium chartae]|uniref:Amidohydrolase 3 domain-containing protein n=1 Tax=Deinobacterium chartae TaxID=521158 RepID=A0A841I2U8_9DEIO|nr:amidohydrolase [Deinobacterium chartae]MBB6098699.1 hypothetical protein [Deinobacterium chartae]